MLFLFALVGISSLVLSLALNYSFGILDPIIFTGVGWLSVVVTYYISYFLDHARIFILNRNYEAYIVRDDNGSFWNGKEWASKGKPKLFFNNFQVDKELRFIYSEYANEVESIYVRVILPGVFFDKN